ncbi:MAG: MucB/RseB C-terminal domain-containing protein [Pseudomonadales bacterium]|jgi:sigma-E factor negative regulatory protein RseB
MLVLPTQLRNQNSTKRWWYAFALCLMICAGSSQAASLTRTDSAASEPQSAEHWLSAMVSAFSEQTYSGTFTYIRGSEFTTMQIAHDARNGPVKEAILRLNGPKIQIRRSGDVIVCHHEAANPGSLRHDVLLGPFSQSFNDLIQQSSRFYELRLSGEGRIANRSAVRLSIQPVKDDRFGYFLWIDRETGLLLQSHLLERGRVKEVFSFSQIEFDQISEDAFASLDETRTVSHRLTDDVIEKDAKPTFKVRWLPAGFRVVRQAGNRVHFSDGLVNFSVFLEPKKGLPNLATQVRGRTIVTRTLKNQQGQVTIIGGLPVVTAQKLAESVEPILY